MTIGSVTVNIQLAFPQGWTADEIRERVVELMAEHIAPQDGVVEFAVESVTTNADPFGKQLAPLTFGGGIAGLGSGAAGGKNPYPSQSPLSRFNDW